MMNARQALLLFSVIQSVSGNAEQLRGVVQDEQGGAVSAARVTLFRGQGSALRETASKPDGSFEFSSLTPGSYGLTISAPGFAEKQIGVRLPSDELTVSLSLQSLSASITVTASRGQTDEVADAVPLITVRNRDYLQERPLPTIGNALENAPGVLVQQSTAGQVSPFLRGLTGYHVLNLVDGIRFNNSTFRSGPNQYLALLEPSEAQRVEAMLGPTGAQFGSDSLGGAIHVITAEPRFGSSRALETHGELNAFGATADMSSGLNGLLSLGTPRAAFLVGGTGRRHNDLRAGGGSDSRNVFRKLFGISGEQVSDLIGSRQQDSGFSQYGWYGKAAFRPAADQTLTFWYQRSEIHSVRGYKDLLGGLGRLRSDFDPQQLDLFYARYEKLGVGPLDSVTGTFSINSQEDGSARRGLRWTDPLIRDYSAVDSYGYIGQAAKQIGPRHSIVFGGEFYDERIDSTRFENDDPQRPLYPDDSRYRTLGLFAQDSIVLLPGRLRASLAGRLTRISYRTIEDSVLGVPASSQNFSDATFNTSFEWQANDLIAFHVLVGRGFRAPNANDLGAVGLNDLGYEIPAADAISAGALLSTSAGEGALSTGRPLEDLGPERLFNYEAGMRFQTSRFYARVHVFDAELLNPIVRRTLLFPAGSLPGSLAGLTVTPIPPTAAQREQGVAAVATSLDPRAVKAFVNDGHARYYGTEALMRYAFTSNWMLRSNYTFLAGRELNPNRPIRRLPPQQGYIALRRTSAKRIWWEISGTFTGRQERLSGGDIDDERIGASRRRSDIADFFRGARVSQYLNGEGVFLPTGETLVEIQDRVLPVRAVINGVQIINDGTRVPLYRSTAGWITVDLLGGIPAGERLTFNFGLLNLLDKSYRVHGSGIDGPGRNGYVGIHYQF
ncbi:MAG: TonB-dependent receptor [Bryobacteraceae bacterium]